MRDDAERLALVVHEVRSPVAALAAIRDALPGARGDRGACQRLARLALGACEAIDRLVREVAVTTVVPEAVDLSAVVEDVVGAAALASRREISASGTERPLVVQGDPVRLRQAVDNVVRNAIAVSPPGTAIAVSLRATRREAMISVTDAGPGIADSDRERIFEPGVRLDPQRPGSGLGLAVARGIAEAHGGRLTVESERGAGATFTLVVPRPPPQPETPTSSS